MAKHLDRSILIDICKDGTVTFRERNSRTYCGGVPIFSTDSAEEAQSLLTYLCTEQETPHPSMPTSRWFIFDEFHGDPDELPAVTAQFIEAYHRLNGKETC